MTIFSRLASTRQTTIFSVVLCLLLLRPGLFQAQTKVSSFQVIGFYTAKNDAAHISFVHEANNWFTKISGKYGFSYDSTSDWNKLTAAFLSHYQVVVFLDTRPDGMEQRTAFQTYMENGGGWIGFHFAAFALTPSEFPQNWNWYHDIFLGSGQYVSNTWRPVAAVLRVEDHCHPVTANLPATFTSSPNEWYRWEHDLRCKPFIHILVSIDTASFPLGTGPKPSEIWHSGYYPVVWTNTQFRMIYFNMGHNDIDYEHKFDLTNRTLSHTFGNDIQDQLIINALLWLGTPAKKD